MDGDLGPALEQVVDQRQGRGLADVVGLGLEGQAPQGELLAGQVAAEMLLDLVHQHVLLAVVDLIDRVEQQRLDADLAGQVGQGPHVLGEAAAAVADAGKQELQSRSAGRGRCRGGRR